MEKRRIAGMGTQADVKRAIEGERADVIRVLAEHRILPTVVERAESGSSLLGRSTPTVGLEPQADDSGTIDRQTTRKVVDTLGVDSEEDCESVREEIRDHSAW
jgi:hypothetical protein